MTARARLVLDLALFAVLVIAYYPGWSGLPVHEWLCLAAIVPLLFHIIVNWDQTLQIIGRFADFVRHTPRVNLVVDSALFISVVGVMLSGFAVSQVISGALGIVVAPSAIWVTIHSFTADATIALLLVHFALHWKWIVRVARRLVRLAPAGSWRGPASAPSTRPRLPPARLAPAPSRASTSPRP